MSARARSTETTTHATPSSDRASSSLSDLARHVRDSPHAPIWTLVFITVTTFGYEVFNFNLTGDESGAALRGPSAFAQSWLEQQRWGMAGLTILLPVMETPAVVAIIGVSLSVTAWWLISRQVLILTRWQAAGATGLAVTSPVLALMVSFSTTILGIGVGQLCLFVFAYMLRKGSPQSFLIAGIAATLANSMYDAFLLSCAILGVVVGFQKRSWKLAGWGLALSLFAALATRLVSIGLNAALGIQKSSYTASYLDISGLIASPISRLKKGFYDGLSPMIITNQRFGYHAIWVWLVFSLLCVIISVGLIWNKTALRDRLLAIFCFTTLLLAPGFAAASSSRLLPLRANIFVPVIWLGLATMAFSVVASRQERGSQPGQGKHPHVFRERRWLILLFSITLSFAILSQSMVSNRVLAATDTALAHDRFLAFTIEQRRAELAGLDSVVPVVMFAGDFQWSNNPLTPTVAQNGASLLGEGAVFLSGQGVKVKPPSSQQEARGYHLLKTMPQYPAPGWITYQDGLLLINLSSKPVA